MIEVEYVCNISMTDVLEAMTPKAKWEVFEYLTDFLQEDDPSVYNREMRAFCRELITFEEEASIVLPECDSDSYINPLIEALHRVVGNSPALFDKMKEELTYHFGDKLILKDD